MFDDPNAEIQSQIVSTYTLGCIFGAILTIFTGDVLGRRRSVLFGCTLLVIGGVLQASAFSLPHMIVGRITSGLGIGRCSLQRVLAIRQDARADREA